MDMRLLPVWLAWSPITVPAVSVCVLGLIVLGTLHLQLRGDLQQIREQRLRLLQIYADQVRLALPVSEALVRNSDVSAALRRLTPPTSSTDSALVDREMRVISSSTSAWRGRQLSEVVPAGGPQTGGENTDGVSHVGDHVHLLLPWGAADTVRESDWSGAPTWLYLGASVRAPLADETRQAHLHMAAVGLMIALYAIALALWLHLRLLRPLRAVRRSVEMLDAEDADLQSSDEMLRESDDLADMLDRVGQRQKSLLVEADYQRRLLGIVTGCSAALLQGDTLRQATQGVCDALVAQGFGAVWVGLNENVGHSMRLVAKAGGCDHLAEHPGDLVPEEEVLLGSVVDDRTVHRVFLQPGAGGDNGLAERAARNGCSEMAIVPLLRDGRRVGVLVLLHRNRMPGDSRLDSVLYDIGTWLGSQLARLVKNGRQQLLEGQLDDERLLLRAVIDSTPDLIFVKDKASLYLGCNRAFERLVNRAERDIVGGSDFDLFDEAQALRFRDDDGNVVNAQEAKRVREWVDYPDGSRVLLESLKNPYRDADGTVRGLVCISRDITAQYQAEKALREERSLFVAGPTVVFRWQLAAGWPVLYVSPNVEEQFGYLAHEFVTGARNYADIVHPDDLPRVAQEVEAFMADGRCEHFEQRYRVRHAEGAYRWVFDLTSLARATDGTVSGLSGYVVDITSTVDLELRLKERIKELRGLYRILQLLADSENDIHDTLKATVNQIPSAFQFPDCTVVRLTQGTVAYASGRFAESEDNIAVPWRGANGEKGLLEVCCIDRERVAEAPVFLDEERDLVGAIAAEISHYLERRELMAQQRQSAEEIARREQRFRAVSESSRDFIYEYDPARRERKWYGRVRESLGFDHLDDRNIASDWPRYLHPDDVNELIEATRFFKEDGTAYDLTYRVRTAEGTWRYWRDRGTVVSKEGRSACVIGICADLTDVVTAAEDRILVEQRLKQGDRLETLVYLARGAATDLNGKLMVIQGYTNLLARKADKMPKEDVRSRLGKINVAARELAAVVAGFNAFSETTTSRPLSLNVNSVIDRAVALTRASLPETLQLRTTCGPDVPAVIGEQSDMVHVVVSLCLHLRESMGDESVIEIATATGVVGEQTCSACGKGLDGEWVKNRIAGWRRAEESRDDQGAGVCAEVSDEVLPVSINRLVSQSGGHLLIENEGEENLVLSLLLVPNRPAANVDTSA